jgi:hypothetical protein
MPAAAKAPYVADKLADFAPGGKASAADVFLTAMLMTFDCLMVHAGEFLPEFVWHGLGDLRNGVAGGHSHGFVDARFVQRALACKQLLLV